MSFITKRERVFNEYDVFDLPGRNEGKLKAYASCTDARAWSHFCSDKTEHLVEIIKRNNEKYRTTYVPTSVIVDTLMASKNMEITRLKQKIDEFQQMLAAYDLLDLTCEQKCEIVNAHDAIRAANKELDDMCLDLDLSGFTEGMESDAFETGKSRGDEPNRCCPESAKSRGGGSNATKMEAKSNQTSVSKCCDVSTSVHDPRIQEMKDTIISKDAKLNAMQNTVAVMENDVCEPYCVYAHINTALEKIFGVLCQNDKYKVYLSMMTAGKDTRKIDIKGKILFKLKVLEKFSLALIAPCSQGNMSSQYCDCMRAEVIARLDFPSSVEAKTPPTQAPSTDNKRAHLIADIMANDEMKELLSKDSESEKHFDDQTDDGFGFDTYSIDTENLRRLKNLQENYDDLMTCYEKLKYEKDNLQTRCYKYEELETEFTNLKSQLQEYNVLWTEREHYRKRSMDVDSLKEQYLVLADETSNLETQLKAESKINHIKSLTIEELRDENIALERKINEALISFEKEKNTLQCKLKETECTVMCQDQQIKSLSLQIDRLLEQNQENMQQHEDTSHSLALIDEIESLKQQIQNLKDTLFCSEEEKQHLQDEFQDQLNIINALKMEIEDWKSTCEKTVQRNEYLEKYTGDCRDEVHRLIEENRNLSQEVEEKKTAVGNLINVINTKSQEVNKLSEEIEQKNKEQKVLRHQIQELREVYHHNISAAEDEKTKALQSLQLTRQESEELLSHMRDYDNVLNQKDNISKSLETKTKDYDDIKKMLKDTMEQNKSLQMDLISRENNNSIPLQEIQTLREVNSYAIDNISNLQNQKNEYRASLELTRKESETLENKLQQLEYLTQESDFLKNAYENLTSDKERLENELKDKKNELEQAMISLQFCKKESEELISKLDQTRIWEEEMKNLNKTQSELMIEKSILQSELIDERKRSESILKSLNEKNDLLLKTSQKVSALENELMELQKAHAKSSKHELLKEKDILQTDFDNKTEALNNLYNNLESKIEDNSPLLEKIKILERNQITTSSSMATLQNENKITQNMLNAMQKESAALIDKLKHYETLEAEYEKLKFENECIQNELSHQMTLFKRLQQENEDLNGQNRNLRAINEDLEKSLINTRNQLIKKPGEQTITYEDISRELEEMKKEKLHSHNKIKDLLNRLDESDNIISNLTEDIMARDDKVAILENHINHLEDEIRKLQNNLEDVINTGESIKDNSYINMDHSLKTLEAHHSKAAHNMKMELAKLQNENSKLEQQLSATKLKTEESSRDKNKYLSQLVHLQNEREVIVTDIKQLELKSVDDSNLAPAQCSVEDVLASLERIRKSIEAKSSKSSIQEQTLLKVQTTSQLLLTKADEAKKIVEKEKQKIIMEKEDAIRDRSNMEKRVEELRNKLDNQINKLSDSKIIKDLEANILNQKLWNEHTISKLKEELRTLQSSNQNLSEMVNTLQEKNRRLTEENEKYMTDNDKLSKNLDNENKIKETLQNKLEDLCNKPVRNTGIQNSLSGDNKTVATQTDTKYNYDYENALPLFEPHITDIKDSSKNVQKNIETYANKKQVGAPTENKQVSNLIPKQIPNPINEVQILTANTEPSFDFVRNSYRNYKIQRLSPGRLEQYSISNTDDPECHSQGQNKKVAIRETDPNLIDIYNRSIHSTSSKLIENEVDNVVTRAERPNLAKSSISTEFDFTNENIDNNDINQDKYEDFSFIESTSQKSPTTDLFVIYKDSESTYKNKNYNKKIPMTTMEQAEMIAEKVTGQYSSKEKIRSKQSKEKKYLVENDSFLEDEEYNDYNAKPKLNINLPRVDNYSHSLVGTSEGDKKSIDSYTLNIYPAPKQNSFTDIKLSRGLDYTNLKQETPSLPTISNDENQYLGSYNSDEKLNQASEKYGKKIKSRKKNFYSNKNTNMLNDASHHKLSRVGADVYLIRSKSNLNDKEETNKQSGNFALDYILDSVQGEIKSHNIKTLGNTKDLRKIKSDERFSLTKASESSTSNHSPVKVSSLEYKTISSPTYSKVSNKNNIQSVAERSGMVRIDDNEDYESKIKYLIKLLENTERDYKKKIDAIKVQYDINIKNILTEHNIGVKNIQGLHEETLQDIIKSHENEIENLRTMSIEANRKAEKLEKENRILKSQIPDNSSTTGLDEEPPKIISNAKKRRRSRNTKMLTKTNIEAFNVKLMVRPRGPCTCSLESNVSDTIRNIFEQVDVDQRKLAEHTYLKYIANKILSGNVENLDAQELSFLHLKVCRTWKTKITRAEALQNRIDSLECELLNKQRHTQQHIAELDRKVAEERRRLQVVREAVCRSTPIASRHHSPDDDTRCVPPNTTAEKDNICNCARATCMNCGERRSAGDLASGLPAGLKQKRTRTESNRAVLAKMDIEERREKKLYNDEPPTRLRRSHDRTSHRCHKK